MMTQPTEDKPGTCLVCELGLLPFPEAMAYERRLLTMRAGGEIEDTLLLLEHPPTITVGRFGDRASVLLGPAELAQRGIAYYDADRGGDATYNCPGQLVVHPIMHQRLRGARAYIDDLEELCLRVIRAYGIPAARSPQHPGVWVGEKQLCAVGLRFSRGVSMHGLSLNVDPDLSLFRTIHLCGLPGRAAASLAGELGRPVPMAEVTQRVQAEFAKIFHVALTPISKEELTRRCFGEKERPCRA